MFQKRRALCGAWSKSGIILTDSDMFMLDLHRCCPEWHLALLVLINCWSWHLSIFPVRWWGGSRSEAWASNAEQMKHCSLHQSFVEPDAGLESTHHILTPLTSTGALTLLLCRQRKIVSSMGFSHSWWLS